MKNTKDSIAGKSDGDHSRKNNGLKAVNTPVHFGAILKKARTNKKLSQEDVADLLGVTRFAVTNWETDKNKPDHDLIPKLCKILGLYPNDLYKMQNQLSPFESSIVDKLRFMTPSAQRLSKSVLDNILDNDIAEHDKELRNNTRIIDLQPGALAAGTASSGLAFIEEAPTPFFIKCNWNTSKADAVVTRLNEMKSICVGDDYKFILAHVEEMILKYQKIYDENRKVFDSQKHYLMSHFDDFFSNTDSTEDSSHFQK